MRRPSTRTLRGVVLAALPRGVRAVLRRVRAAAQRARPRTSRGRRTVPARQVAKGKGVSWQAQRQNSAAKVALIEPVLAELGCGSVLDVGCNAGQVTRLLGDSYFAVGVDQKLDLRGYEQPLVGACLGQMAVNEDLLDRLPRFDAVLLLSVHHQWVQRFGDELARAMVQKLANTANAVLFIEFSALNSKYDDTGSSTRFRDNDERSVRTYAEAWLRSTLPDLDTSYLGATPESSTEPLRFMYSCCHYPFPPIQ